MNKNILGWVLMTPLIIVAMSISAILIYNAPIEATGALVMVAAVGAFIAGINMVDP